MIWLKRRFVDRNCNIRRTLKSLLAMKVGFGCPPVHHIEIKRLNLTLTKNLTHHTSVEFTNMTKIHMKPILTCANSYTELEYEI